MLTKSNQSPSAIINDIMEQSDYNGKRAKNALINRAEHDSVLRKYLIHLGVNQAIRDHFHEARRIETSFDEISRYEPRLQNAEPEVHQERQRQKIERREFWDRYSLFGHIPLKVAKRPDLDDSIEKRKIQIAGNIQCTNFEIAVKRRIHDDVTTVGKALKISDLLKLAKQHGVIRGND